MDEDGELVERKIRNKGGIGLVVEDVGGGPSASNNADRSHEARIFLKKMIFLWIVEHEMDVCGFSRPFKYWRFCLIL